MNWYDLVKLSMPLPRSTGLPEDWKEKHWQYPAGLRKLDDAIPEEIDDYMGELETTEENFGHLGGGYFTIPEHPDKGVKYTVDKSEIEFAKSVWQKQMEIGGFLPFVVGLYDFTREPVEGTSAYRLMTEKVEPVEKTEFNDYLDMFTWGAMLNQSDKSQMDYYVTERVSPETEFKGADIDKRRADIYEWNTGKKFDKNMYDKVHQALINFINDFDQFNAISRDLHTGNLGIRRLGNEIQVVLTDLGHTYMA
jgi:hypothetical protein